MSNQELIESTYQELIESTYQAALAEEDGWEWEDYESSNDRVAHRAVFTPWGYACSYTLIAADGGQIDYDRARSYFDKRLKQSIEHFEKKGMLDY